MTRSFSPQECRIVDLTLPLNPHTPSPCVPGVETRTLCHHESNTATFSCQMMWFSMNDHCGTHMDAPLHFIPNGKAVHELDLAHLCFMPGICLDCTPSARYQPLEVDCVEQALHTACGMSKLRDVPPGAFILLHTGHDRYAGTPAYYEAPFLTPDAAHLLTQLRPRAIGVNAPTVDDRRMATRPVHTQLLGQDIAVIEGVTNSAQLVGIPFLCTALPLNLTGFTGSPLRLVALVQD